MANPRILDTLLPHYASDLVAIYDQNFNQVFPRARPLKLTIREIAKVMEHPVENGTIITDHRVILPVEVEASMLIQSADAQDTYRIIRQLYLNGTLLIVQSKAAVYRNQMIASLPHEEDPDQYGAIPVALKFKQVQFVTETFSVVSANPTNATTTDRGIQNNAEAPPEQSSTSQRTLENFFVAHRGIG